jgi:hypothetical protein
VSGAVSMCHKNRYSHPNYSTVSHPSHSKPNELHELYANATNDHYPCNCVKSTVNFEFHIPWPFANKRKFDIHISHQSELDALNGD